VPRSEPKPVPPKPIAVNEPWSEIVSIFLASRVCILLIGWLANLIIPKSTQFGVPNSDSLLEMFFRWDCYWYMRIVENGYSYVPGQMSNVNFFPLYPILVRLFSYLTGDPMLAGFIISNAALLLAAVFLYKLARLDFTGSVPSKAVLYMLVFPASLFFSVFYSEGLFLFLTVSSFYYARKGQWAAASALGFFAALTRSVGVLIFIPLLMEYLNINFGSLKPDFRKLRADIGYLLLVPAGLLIHMAYLQFTFGDSLLFIEAQSAWNRHFTSILTTVEHAAWYSPFHQAIFLGSAAFAAIMIAYMLYRRVRLSYLAYSALLLFIFLSGNIPEGMQRYVAVLFPVYIGMSLLGERSRFLEALFTFLSAMLLALFVMLYVQGYFMT